MRKTVATLAACMTAAVPLAACSDDGTSGKASSSPSAGSSSSTAGRTTIHITVEDGDVTPQGTRVKATVGSPIVLRIDADQAGEIHVHSTPEQHLEFPKGTSTRTVTIDQPGIVDVEDHALDKVIVQLEVVQR